MLTRLLGPHPHNVVFYSIGSMYCPWGKSTEKIQHMRLQSLTSRASGFCFIPFFALCLSPFSLNKLLLSLNPAVEAARSSSTGFNHAKSSFCKKRAESGPVKITNAKEGKQNQCQKPIQCQPSVQFPWLQLVRRTYFIPVAVCLIYFNSIYAHIHIKCSRKGLHVIIYTAIHKLCFHNKNKYSCSCLQFWSTEPHAYLKPLTGNTALMRLPGITCTLMLMFNKTFLIHTYPYTKASQRFISASLSSNILFIFMTSLWIKLHLSI